MRRKEEHHRIRNIFRGLLIVLGMLVLVQAGELVWYGGQVWRLKQAMEPFSYIQPNEEAMTVLILGDSTGVGVGADFPRETIAGLLEQDGASVVNKARAGDYTYEILDQINELDGEYYDLVLIFVGGNDVLWFENLDKAAEDLKEVLRAAHYLGERIVLLPPGNLGLAPLFRDPIGWLYSGRTWEARQKFMQVASESGVVYLDLFTNSLRELFTDEPRKYFAADLLHPSSEGYRIWYEKIKRTLRERGVAW